LAWLQGADGGAGGLQAWSAHVVAAAAAVFAMDEAGGGRPGLRLAAHPDGSAVVLGSLAVGEELRAEAGAEMVSDDGHLGVVHRHLGPRVRRATAIAAGWQATWAGTRGRSASLCLTGGHSPPILKHPETS
jgi:hypothetical protein